MAEDASSPLPPGEGAEGSQHANRWRIIHEAEDGQLGETEAGGTMLGGGVGDGTESGAQAAREDANGPLPPSPRSHAGWRLAAAAPGGEPYVPATRPADALAQDLNRALRERTYVRRETTHTQRLRRRRQRRLILLSSVLVLVVVGSALVVLLHPVLQLR